MSTLKYKDSVSKLLELFPEFKDTDGYEMIKDELYLAYIVFTHAVFVFKSAHRLFN